MDGQLRVIKKGNCTSDTIKYLLLSNNSILLCSKSVAAVSTCIDIIIDSTINHSTASRVCANKLLYRVSN